MYVALAPLTDKMDPKYIIPSEAYESHDDAHPKKTNVGHLEFLKKWQKTSFFSCFSAARPPRRLIFCVGDPLIKYWELNFNFRYGSHLGFLRKWQKKHWPGVDYSLDVWLSVCFSA